MGGSGTDGCAKVGDQNWRHKTDDTKITDIIEDKIKDKA